LAKAQINSESTSLSVGAKPHGKPRQRDWIFFLERDWQPRLHAMKTSKTAPIICLLFLALAVGCAENKTAKTENPSPAYVTTAVTNAPSEQELTPTSDRPDAQPHIYSNSTSRAASPSSTENP
jgi:hypothetical protein